jgi:DNA-binding MarR family transcriptional regulator
MGSVAHTKQLLNAMRTLSTQQIMLHQAVADRLNLNITDYKCMDFIARFGPMTAGKLAELSGLTTGAITGAIDRLEKAGYARRIDNPRDRRSVIVELTWDETNRKRYEETFLPLEREMKRMTASYTNKELALFTELICKVAKLLHEETVRLSKK